MPYYTQNVYKNLNSSFNKYVFTFKNVKTYLFKSQRPEGNGIDSQAVYIRSPFSYKNRQYLQNSSQFTFC